MGVVTGQLVSNGKAPRMPFSHLADAFGGRRGWLQHRGWQMAARLGLLRSWRRIDWPRVCRLVFVCQGNICRSAYAERRAATCGLPAISAGLNVRAQDAPPSAVQAAADRGLDLAHHRPRPLADWRLAAGDLLVAMEPQQAFELRDALGPLDSQITILGLWTKPMRPYLQDPYGLSDAYFRRCFEVIDDGVAALAARLDDAHDSPDRA